MGPEYSDMKVMDRPRYLTFLERSVKDLDIALHFQSIFKCFLISVFLSLSNITVRDTVLEGESACCLFRKQNLLFSFQPRILGFDIYH